MHMLTIGEAAKLDRRTTERHVATSPCLTRPLSHSSTYVWCRFSARQWVPIAAPPVKCLRDTRATSSVFFHESFGQVPDSSVYW